MTELATKRLILESLTDAHRALMVDLYTCTEVTACLDEPPTSPKQVTQVIDRFIYEYTELGIPQWAAIVRATGEPIGSLGYKPTEQVEGLDFGYVYLPKFWGVGYATEAGQACIDDVFRNLPVDLLTAETGTGNAASRRVLHKLGFTQAGITRDGDLKFLLQRGHRKNR